MQSPAQGQRTVYSMSYPDDNLFGIARVDVYPCQHRKGRSYYLTSRLYQGALAVIERYDVVFSLPEANQVVIDTVFRFI